MKGFVAILEAFLAIALIYIVLSQIQISLPARYADSANIDRLHRYAHDAAFSVCGSLKDRRMLMNDTMEFGLGSKMPPDMCYHLYVYKNSSQTHLLDSLVFDYNSSADGGCDTSGTTPQSATSTCLIAGGPNATTVSTSSCTFPGGDCLATMASSDNNRLNLNGLSDGEFTMSFNVPSNGSMVEFILEGYSNQSGTTYLFDSAANLIAMHNFSTVADEIYTFDLTGLLPDERNSYNITVMPHIFNASYDYAYLNVSYNIYSPRRVVVQTWNTGA